MSQSNHNRAPQGEAVLRELFDADGYKNVSFSADARLFTYAKAAVRDHIKVHKGLDGRGDDRNELAVAAGHIGYEIGQADARSEYPATTALSTDDLREAIRAHAQYESVASTQEFRTDAEAAIPFSRAMRGYGRGILDAAVQLFAERSAELRSVFDRAVTDAARLGAEWDRTRSEATLLAIELRIAEIEVAHPLDSLLMLDPDRMEEDDLLAFVRRHIELIAFEAEARRIGQERLLDQVRGRSVAPEVQQDRLQPDLALRSVRDTYMTKAGSRRQAEIAAQDPNKRVNLIAERRVWERVAYAPIDHTTLMTIDAERRQRNIAEQAQRSRTSQKRISRGA